MAEGSGYNPYRKSNGEFSSKDEIGDLNEKLASDLVDAHDAGDDRLAAQIESYAMEKLPESPMGKKLLEDRYGTSATAQRQTADHSKLGVRDLQRLAKDTTDPELQLEVAQRGNSAALKNLARNLEATPEALEAAYIRTDDDSVRQELAANPESDLRIMHPSHVAHAAATALERAGNEKTKELRQPYKDRVEAISSANWVDDATVAELQKIRAADPRSRGPRVEVFIDRAMANPKNLISEDAAISYAKSSPRAGSIALEAGRISPSRLSELPASSARFERASDPALLAEAAKLSEAGSWDSQESDPWGKVDPYGRKSREIANRIAENEATPPAALEALVGNPRADQLKLYGNGRLSESSKRKLEATSPDVQSHLRLERAAGGRDRVALREELKVSGTEVNTQRGYHRTDIVLDRAKIESYGLSKGDVERLMGGDGNLYSYDPASGRYSGSYDSGD